MTEDISPGLKTEWVFAKTAKPDRAVYAKIPEGEKRLKKPNKQNPMCHVWQTGRSSARQGCEKLGLGQRQEVKLRGQAGHTTPAHQVILTGTIALQQRGGERHMRATETEIRLQ